VEDAVEAGVADDGDVGDADLRQQLAALVVLHVEMGEAPEHVGILTTVPAEEDLVGSEDAGDAIDGDAAMAQDVQVVVPELVLDEERHDGSDGAQEAACVADGVEWQVADDVGTGIVLAHLVA